MFRKSGFHVYLVDEFRTSCKCSNCEGGECSKFREIRNPKPAKNNSILSHGLIKIILQSNIILIIIILDNIVLQYYLKFLLLCKKDCRLWIME